MTTSPSWPPDDATLAWRPVLPDPEDKIDVDYLEDVGEDLSRFDVVDDEVAAHLLAGVSFDAGRPGGGESREVYAVPDKSGVLRIVILGSELVWEPPVNDLREAPTLGELLSILDDSRIDGERMGPGHPTREYNDMGDGRTELRSLVEIGSVLYPQLAALDESRLEQWIAESP